MHIMIDLETLGLDPATAPIIQIAAVAFNLGVDHVALTPLFTAPIDARSCLMAPFNRRLDPETVTWWAKTDPALFIEIMENPVRLGLQRALVELGNWMSSIEVEGVWGNGPTFDISILETCYKQADIAIPWSYRVIRDVRTMAMIAGEDPVCWEGGQMSDYERTGRAHDAVVDCLRQIRMVQQTWLHHVRQSSGIWSSVG
jgi:hypothetical protein